MPAGVLRRWCVGRAGARAETPRRLRLRSSGAHTRVPLRGNGACVHAARTHNESCRADVLLSSSSTGALS
eukprot:2853451-Lingulodinium_polyedra.AAC.1